MKSTRERAEEDKERRKKERKRTYEEKGEKKENMPSSLVIKVHTSI